MVSSLHDSLGFDMPLARALRKPFSYRPASAWQQGHSEYYSRVRHQQAHREERKDLQEQTQVVQTAKNEADVARSAWQKANGKGKADRRAIWLEAAKREDAAVKEKEQIRQSLQSLFDRLPRPLQVSSRSVLDPSPIFIPGKHICTHSNATRNSSHSFHSGRCGPASRAGQFASYFGHWAMLVWASNAL